MYDKMSKKEGNRMIKVLFTGCTFNGEIIEKLKEKNLEIIPTSPNLTQEKLIEVLQDCDAVIVNGEEKYTEEVLSKCEKLKVIQFFGIGYAKCIDIEVAQKYEKIVANTPKVNSYSVAEFTLGLIFTLNQKLLQHHEETKNGKWEEKKFFDLKDKVIGIIGLGHIGTYFAEIMYNAFHAQILYYDKEEKSEIATKYNAKKVSLEEIFKNSDIVSLHLPLNIETKNLIGENELSLMKKSAYFINTARAEIVNAEALYNCLKNNEIAGCAFDGFYQEPVDLTTEEAKLLTLPTGKFILTPHTGHNALEGTKRVEKMCIENLIQIFNNEPCKGIVNK